MARIELDGVLWARFIALCGELDIADPARYLEQWMRQLIARQRATDGRYWPVVCALVTMGKGEVLLVGNEYVGGSPCRGTCPAGW